MSEAVQVEVIAPPEVIGRSEYSIAVTVANRGDTPIDRIEIIPQILHGELLSREFQIRDSEEALVDAQMRNVRFELEAFVRAAYVRLKRRRMTWSQKLWALFFVSPHYEIPTEALRIDDWDDVASIENDLLINEPEDSVLRTGFAVAKAKLQRLIGRGKTFTSNLCVSPKSSVGIPFVLRAPRAWRPKVLTARFRVTYRDTVADRTTTESITRDFTLLPSPFAIPLGGVVGGICGDMMRQLLQAHSLNFAWSLLGAALLGLILAAYTSRKPDVFKAVTVEDFMGGVVVGAFAGMFAPQLFEYLSTLAPRGKAG